MNAQHDEEFCPRCGQWCLRLAASGWCAECSLSQHPGAVQKREWRRRNREHDLAYNAAYKREWRRRDRGASL